MYQPNNANRFTQSNRNWQIMQQFIEIVQLIVIFIQFVSSILATLTQKKQQQQQQQLEIIKMAMVCWYTTSFHHLVENLAKTGFICVALGVSIGFMSSKNNTINNDRNKKIVTVVKMSPSGHSLKPIFTIDSDDHV